MFLFFINTARPSTIVHNTFEYNKSLRTTEQRPTIYSRKAILVICLCFQPLLHSLIRTFIYFSVSRSSLSLIFRVVVLLTICRVLFLFPLHCSRSQLKFLIGIACVRVHVVVCDTKIAAVYAVRLPLFKYWYCLLLYTQANCQRALCYSHTPFNPFVSLCSIDVVFLSEAQLSQLLRHWWSS